MVGESFRKIGLRSGSENGSESGSVQCVELITGRVRRRLWTAAEKAAIVAESLEPGAVVTLVARRHRITRGLLWKWRQQIAGLAVAKAAVEFVPLRLASGADGEALKPATTPETPVDPAPYSASGAAVGLIEIEVGRARVRVRGYVDVRALRQVLIVLGQSS